MAQPVSIGNPIDIQITADKRIQFSMGGASLTGDFRMRRGQGQDITFQCAQPFILALTDFADATPGPAFPGNRPVGQGSRRFPASQIPVTDQAGNTGPVFWADANAPLTLTLQGAANLVGIYKYCVVVTLTDGSLVTIDPQIIVD